MLLRVRQPHFSFPLPFFISFLFSVTLAMRKFCFWTISPQVASNYISQPALALALASAPEVRAPWPARSGCGTSA